MYKFWSFVEYMTMYDIGELDAIARNYALDHTYGLTPHPQELYHGYDFVRLALKRIGFPSGENGHANTVELITALNNHKYYPPYQLVLKRLAEWYTYDRIRSGELRRWPLARKAIRT